MMIAINHCQISKKKNSIFHSASNRLISIRPAIGYAFFRFSDDNLSVCHRHASHWRIHIHTNVIHSRLSCFNYNFLVDVVVRFSHLIGNQMNIHTHTNHNFMHSIQAQVAIINRIVSNLSRVAYEMKIKEENEKTVSVCLG